MDVLGILILSGHGNQNLHAEPLVPHFNIHLAVVLMHGVLDASQTVAVKALVLLGGFGKLILQGHGITSFIIILATDYDESPVLLDDRQVDHPLIRVGDRLLIFDGVVQCISKDGADIDDIHEGQEFAVDDGGEQDALVQAGDALGAEEGVQDVVAGLVLNLVIVDLLFYLVQHLAVLLSGVGGAHQGDVLLQVMVLVIDVVRDFLRLGVLLVLGLKDGFHLHHILGHVDVQDLGMVGVEHGNASQIDEGAQLEDGIGVASGEGSVGDQEADVAEGEDEGSDEYGCDGFLVRDLHQLILLGKIMMVKAKDQEGDQTVNHNQNESIHNPEIFSHPAGIVAHQHPVDGGHEFGDDEGFRAVEKGCLNGTVMDAGDIEQHEGDGYDHAQDPERAAADAAGYDEEGALDCQEEGGDGVLLPAVDTLITHEEGKNAGQPFRQSSDQAGDIRQNLR